MAQNLCVQLQLIDASFALDQYLGLVKMSLWNSSGMQAPCGSWQAVAESLTPIAARSLLCFEFSQTRAPRAGLCLPGTDTAPGDSSAAGISGLQNTVSTEVEGCQQSGWRAELQGTSKPRQQSRCLRLLGNLARGTAEVPLQWMHEVNWVSGISWPGFP